MQFFRETKIDFLGKKFLAISLSLLLIAACCVYVAVNGLHLGIDFAGGNLIQLKFNELPSLNAIRANLATVGYGDAMIQADAEHRDVMIRVQREDLEDDGATAGSAAQEDVVNRIIDALSSESDLALIEEGRLNLNLEGKDRVTELLAAEDNDPLALRRTNLTTQEIREIYGDLSEQLIDRYRETELHGIFTEEGLERALDSLVFREEHAQRADDFRNFIPARTFLGNFSRIRAEMVSAVVGAELGEQAVWAIVFSLGGILAYIWFRFNPRFSVAAIAATIHDLLITVGIFSMTGREFNLPIVAGLLTIVGYSLNDTIVVFDRIRENLTIRRREARDDYEGILNASINSTLGRTLLTSVTTLIVVLFLFFMGGSVINDFAFTLIIGILVGTYSSIFIASPVLAIWQKITGTMGGQLGRMRGAKA